MKRWKEKARYVWGVLVAVSGFAMVGGGWVFGSIDHDYSKGTYYSVIGWALLLMTRDKR